MAIAVGGYLQNVEKKVSEQRGWADAFIYRGL